MQVPPPPTHPAFCQVSLIKTSTHLHSYEEKGTWTEKMSILLTARLLSLPPDINP